MMWERIHCKLFKRLKYAEKWYLHKPESVLENEGFGLVGFYDISTILGDLMQNPLHMYILNIGFVNILLITLFNKPELIFCTQLNGFTYCYVTVTT